jgi:FkbM family methyltransferase
MLEAPRACSWPIAGAGGWLFSEIDDMPFVSYAGNSEDVILNRVFKAQATGFYIDVGANDPTLWSMTRSFYDRGWHGINVEPARTAFLKLQGARTRDVNLPIGLSDRPATLTFYECVNEPTWSTFVADEAQRRKKGLDARYGERRVEVWTLAQVCERYVRETIDFLSIDVENHERQVIAGHDWQRWRPRIVLVEDSESAVTRERGHREWEPVLLGADYLFALFDGVNRIYVRREDAELLPLVSVPANVTDDYLPLDYYVLKSKLAAFHDTYGGFASPFLNLAGWLHRLAGKHPRLAQPAKRVLALALARFSNTDYQEAVAQEAHPRRDAA